MTSVLIRLEGPLQAWCTQLRLGIRDTDREPSKSGVLGLVGAALGMAREDGQTLGKLRSLSMSVRVDRSGTLLHDYHTAGGGHFRGRAYGVFDPDDHAGNTCVPSHRYYLQDASFVVALSGDAALVAGIGDALRSPRWALFLGRRACTPSVPPFMGLVDGDARQAVRFAGLAERVARGPLRVVAEVPADQGGEPRYDVPLSFAEGDRRYGVRYVVTEWTEVPPAEGAAAPGAGVPEDEV